MAGNHRDGPVADFCAALRQLQEGSGLTRAMLARKVNYSRSQLYQILNGGIRRPPDWDRVVEPLVRACTGDDKLAIDYWRQRHGELVEIYEADRRSQPDGMPTRHSVTVQVVPAQLPADVDMFTGRTAELSVLDSLLAATPRIATPIRGSTAVVISAVSGTAGVGKTALALRWAHQVRAKFPDGQLYVNLRGYDPDQPMAAGDALAGFLRALGVTDQEIPVDVDERAASYRSLLAGKRMLVVLDNAADVEQLRPLLPGASPCLVVVTSRDSLAGLVARHGARRLDLDLLPLQDAVALLRALIGGRVESEPEAAILLAEQCARLPLALRVAAELVDSRPASSLAELAGELADEQRRLDLLTAEGDPRTAVRSVFSWSYQHLPSAAARAFRVIGLHPGPDLDPYAAAALTDADLEQARQLLNLLTRAHLVQVTNPGRYSMHDLLRVYATELAIEVDTKQDQNVVLARLFDHYLTTAATALNTLLPSGQYHEHRITTSDTPSPPVADSTVARTWLDAEQSVLVTVSTYTATRGWPEYTTRLAATLAHYLDLGGYYYDAVAVHTHALHAAHRIGDLAAEARARSNLGLAYYQLGRYELAADCYQEALLLSRALGDRNEEARTLVKLGLIYWRQGRYESAADNYQQALTLFRELGNQAGEARALGNLGNLCWRQGHYQQAGDLTRQALALIRKFNDQENEARALGNLGLVYCRQGHYKLAAEHYRQALVLSREIGDRESEADQLGNLGTVYRQQGHYELAAEHHQQALALYRELGHRAGEADALGNLGLVYLRQGNLEQATEHHQQSLALFRELGDQAGETEALNGLGETLHATGHPREAGDHHTAALTLATEIGDRFEQARAHNGLAYAHHAIGNTDQARHLWHEAFTLYTDLAVPEANQVRTHLITLDHGAGEDSPA